MLQRVPLRAAGVTVVALLSFATASHPADSESACEPPGAALPGEYEGEYDVRFTGTGGEPKMRVFGNVEGTFRVVVPPSRELGVLEFAGGEGDLKYEMSSQTADVQVVVVGLKWHSTGRLELEGSEHGFRASGRVEGTLDVQGVGLDPNSGDPAMRLGRSFGGQSGRAELHFEPQLFRSFECGTIGGMVDGPFLEELGAKLRAQGIDVGPLRGRWTARVRDSRIPAESDRLGAEAASIPGKPRPNALRRYRDLLGEAERQGRTESEVVCLKSGILNAYLEDSRTWLQEDLSELRRISRGRMTALDRTRIQRLVAQVLGRLREAQLANCEWSEMATGFEQCADAMTRAAEQLLKDGQGLWDQATLREAANLTRSVALLGADDSELMELLASWSGRIANQYFQALKSLGYPKTPQEKVTFEKAAVQALAAERQAQLLNGISELRALPYIEACRESGKC